MRIAFNLLFLVPGETGGLETYAQQLIPQVLRAASEGDDFVAFVSVDAQAWVHLSRVPSLRIVSLPTRSRRREQWVIGEQVLLPRALRRAGVDLVHNLTATGPLVGGTPMVTTTHDLAYHEVPEVAAGLRGRVTRGLALRTMRRSRAVITVSEYARNQILRHSDIAAEDLVVIPNGADEVPPGENSGEQVLCELDAGGRRIVLSPGAYRPHKNAARLIRAVSTIPAEERPVLLLTGHGPGCERELRELVAALGLSDDVRFLGWVTGEQMERLYAASDVLAFPSLHEGFGLPVLEAMRRGVPVVCSGTTSLPEVGGDAVFYFDPLDEAGIADVLRDVLRDPTLRESMRIRGLKAAEAFSWQRAGMATYEVYRRALDLPERAPSR